MPSTPRTPRIPRTRTVPGAVLAGLALAAFAGALLAAGACGRKGSESSGGVAGPPVVNEELGLTLDPPSTAGFQLAANSGTTLELVRPPSEGREAATLSFEVGPEQLAGINLVEAVNRQKAEIEARPGGKFFGQAQLNSQIGTAYSTRGRYTGDDGRELEEVRLFAVHPAGDRLLTLTYRYHPAASDSKERTLEAMGVLGLIQPTDPTGDAGASGGSSP